MGGVRFRGRDWVRTVFWDRNVDPGPCLILGKITVTKGVDNDEMGHKTPSLV